MKKTSFPCPCCGHKTYSEPANGTMQICPVCFWEDAPGEFLYNNSNQVSLIDAQLNYRNHGSCEKEFKNNVRKPLSTEKKDSNWLFIEEIKSQLISKIEVTFSDVRLGSGVSLHQAEASDNYESQEDFLKAKLKDHEVFWTDILDTKLDKFQYSITFLDNEGYCFYLPAFMRFSLNVEPAEFIFYNLSEGPTSNRNLGTFLNPSQKSTIAYFLDYFSRHDTTTYVVNEAQQGLDKGWDKFL